MGSFIDLTGLRFGRLVVLSRAPTRQKRTRWNCLCDCGKATIVESWALKTPHRAHRTVSCGCYHREIASRANTTHGQSKTLARQLFWQAKGRAKRAGLPFTIEPFDVVIPAVCPLLGVVLAAAKGRLGPLSPSLDRIDTQRGYEKGNVWVVSHRANAIKSNATLPELQRLVRALEARCAT